MSISDELSYKVMSGTIEHQEGIAPFAYMVLVSSRYKKREYRGTPVMRTKTLVGAVMLAASANLHAATIDFEGIFSAGGPDSFVSADMYISDMHFTGMDYVGGGLALYRDGYSYADGRDPIDEAALLAFGISTGFGVTEAFVRMESADLSLFSLNSFVTGIDDHFILSAAGDGFFYVDSDELYGVDIGNGHMEYFLPDDWVNLEYVRWSECSNDFNCPDKAKFMLDNITVNSAFTSVPVPIPAAGWLLTGALMSLGALRRRKFYPAD